MKKILIIILALIFFIVMFAIISILGSLKKSPKETPTINPTPTPIQPTTRQGPSSGVIDSKSFSTYLKVAQERPELSDKDTKIRQGLIDSLNDKTGILFEDTNVQIAYLQSPDDFEVEIKSNDVSSAQQKALSYFASKGLSVDGLCKLPVFFFASPSVFQYLEKNGQTLQVVPYFCENLK